MNRLQPLDALRGFIMIVMALDHANAFIAGAHPTPEFWSSIYPRYSDPLSFLTRFVTHLAAPGFFFLMGVGLTLFVESRRQAGWSEWAITKHFLVRGFILLALQFLVENVAWQINAVLTGNGSVFPIYFGVLYGLGGALILASLLRSLDPKLLIPLGIALLLTPELIVGLARPLTAVPLINFLLIPTFTETYTIYYPILPWLGLTLCGMACGRLFLFQRDTEQDSEVSRLRPKSGDFGLLYTYTFYTGLAMLALFFLIRYFDQFGNIRPAPGLTWIDFLNVVKYPPSLTFVLVALGMDFVLLAFFARFSALAQPLTVYGRSPLFFYIVHLFLYGLIGFFFFPAPTGIPRMIPIWLIGLAILYVMCRWYGKFKARQPLNSIWRFA